MALAVTPDAQLTVAPIPSVRAIRLEGELDMSTVARVEPVLAEALASGGPLLIDMSALTFMDSSGIHACIAAARELATKGWCIYLHVNNGSVEKVLRVTGLDRVPNVHIVNHIGANTPTS
jgi:anti-sigma B factor antagonist